MITSRWIPKWLNLYEHFLDEMVTLLGNKVSFQSKQLLSLMRSVHTKRVMFDARQAVIFDAAEPLNVQGAKIKPPFGCFWMEMTEPILVQSQQPGYQDSLVAIIYIDGATNTDVLLPSGMKKLSLGQVIFIFHNFEKNQWVDRSWSVSLDEKIALTTPYTARLAGETEEFFTEAGYSLREGSHVVVAEGTDKQLFQAGMTTTQTGEARTPSWWEFAINDYTQMFLWILTYCMAKSVKVEEMKMPRQQRRALEREEKVPNPWHRVFVEPSLMMNFNMGGEGDTEVGYRFDVIGHLRFNKHKLRDGSYRHTIEWVGDHQRGVKNEIYIPKTYAVKKGKKTLSEMKHYLGEDVNFDNPPKDKS